MRVLAVYESVYGNTREVAEAVRDGLAVSDDVSIGPVRQADTSGCGLLVGGPTHMRGLTTAMSRRIASAARVGLRPIRDTADST